MTDEPLLRKQLKMKALGLQSPAKNKNYRLSAFETLLGGMRRQHKVPPPARLSPQPEMLHSELQWMG
jgi:hypothetical protein